jgi:polar amino acid transport system substrate-binding protein
VGLKIGSTWVKKLNNLSTTYCEKNGLSSITVQEFPTASETAQALMSRNIEAQIEIAGAAKIFTERTNGRIQISSPEIIYPQTLGIYVNKGNTDIKNRLENAMAAIKADGSYLALIEKYELLPITH